MKNNQQKTCFLKICNIPGNLGWDWGWGWGWGCAGSWSPGNRGPTYLGTCSPIRDPMWPSGGTVDIGRLGSYINWVSLKKGTWRTASGLSEIKDKYWYK